MAMALPSGGMRWPSPIPSRWRSPRVSRILAHEVDNISAKRRKFVNVVDPHIKKDLDAIENVLS